MTYLSHDEFMNNATEIVDWAYKASTKDVFDRVVKGINIGDHCKHEDDEFMIKHEVGERIRTALHSIEYIIKTQDRKDFDGKTFYELMHTFIIRCPICNKRLYVKVNNDGVLVLCDENEGKCFERKTYTFTIKTVSDKFIIANDLRDYIEPDGFDGASLNQIKGMYDATRQWAENDVFCVFVGNTTCPVYKHPDGHYTAFSSNFDDLIFDPTSETKEEFLEWVEDCYGMEYYNRVCKTVDLDTPYELLETISCSLWWLMGADVATVDMDTFLNEQHPRDYVILDVVPNSVYEFSVDFTFDCNNGISKFDIKKVD
jgi:hypothetical protein